MSVAELPDKPTHEQIQTFVKQALAPEAKEEPPAGDETPAGDQPVVPAKGDDDQGDEDEAEGQDWLDDDLAAEATAMGISEDELAEFTSREELERALRFLDRRILKAGQEAEPGDGDDEEGDDKEGDGEKEPPRGKDGRFAKQSTEEDAYVPSLNPDHFDEEVIGEFNRLHQHFATRLERLEAEQRSRMEEAAEARFDALVDQLAMPEIFGKTGEETKEELAKRQTLHQQTGIYLKGLRHSGIKGEMDLPLLRRLARGEFADEISKTERKALTRKIQKRSATRTGVGTGKVPDMKESLYEFAERRYRELDNS